MTNARIVRPGFEIAYVGAAERDESGAGFTGITTQVWVRRTISSIHSTGVYLAKDAVVPWYESLVEWDKLWMYRLYIVRRGRSKKNSWEMVERHFLYRIHVEGTKTAWAMAKKAAGITSDSFMWSNNL